MTAMLELLPALGGLASGYSPGRNVAGEAAAALAPEGRKTRSENIARQLAVAGAPAGGLAALHFGMQHRDRLLAELGQRMPGSPVPGLIGMAAPLAFGVGGSLAGGALTGAATGLAQKLRGPLRAKKPEEQAKVAACIDELEKLGAVSPEQARRALDQLDALEQNKPDARQVARYGISGALTGAGISALGNTLEGKPIGGLRGVGAMALKGALSAGAVPLLQAHLDRRAQMGTLKQFVQQPSPNGE